MRTLSLVLAASAAWVTQPSHARSDIPQGTVTYELVVQMDYSNLPPEHESMRDQLPSEIVFRQEMRFIGDRFVTEVGHVTSISGDGGGGGRAAGGAPTEVTFVSPDENLSVRRTNLLDRLFLIEDSVRPYAWRLTGEASTFLGYEVYQAVAETDKGVVEAWFTPEIPAPVGPDRLHGLPGLILLATEDGGRRTFTAQTVNLGPPSPVPARPTEGRRVSAVEFERLVTERAESPPSTRRVGEP